MFKTTTSSIKILDDGVVINKCKTRSAFKKVYILESNSLIAHMIGEEKHPLILDLSKVGKTSFEEIHQMVQKDTTYLCTSMAIVINSSWQRFVLNFWYQVSPLNCPLQFFSNISEAKEWLNSNEIDSTKHSMSA